MWASFVTRVTSKRNLIRVFFCTDCGIDWITRFSHLQYFSISHSRCIQFVLDITALNFCCRVIWKLIWKSEKNSCLKKKIRTSGIIYGQSLELIFFIRMKKIFHRETNFSAHCTPVRQLNDFILNFKIYQGILGTFIY